MFLMLLGAQLFDQGTPSEFTAQGFFVKAYDGLYRGPFEKLNDARDEARALGPDLLIYHGVLKKIDEEVYDDRELFLVPKLDKKSY
jgi:hypothetical protein